MWRRRNELVIIHDTFGLRVLWRLSIATSYILQRITNYCKINATYCKRIYIYTIFQLNLIWYITLPFWYRLQILNDIMVSFVTVLLSRNQRLLCIDVYYKLLLPIIQTKYKSEHGFMVENIIYPVSTKNIRVQVSFFRKHKFHNTARACVCMCVSQWVWSHCSWISK